MTTTDKTLEVRGMTCGGCEASVRNALGKLDGVISTEPDHTADRVSVSFDEGKVSEDDIRERIRAAGFEC